MNIQKIFETTTSTYFSFVELGGFLCVMLTFKTIIIGLLRGGFQGEGVP